MGVPVRGTRAMIGWRVFGEYFHWSRLAGALLPLNAAHIRDLDPQDSSPPHVDGYLARPDQAVPTEAHSTGL